MTNFISSVITELPQQHSSNDSSGGKENKGVEGNSFQRELNERSKPEQPTIAQPNHEDQQNKTSDTESSVVLCENLTNVSKQEIEPQLVDVLLQQEEENTEQPIINIVLPEEQDLEQEQNSPQQNNVVDISLPLKGGDQQEEHNPKITVKEQLDQKEVVITEKNNDNTTAAKPKIKQIKPDTKISVDDNEKDSKEIEENNEIITPIQPLPQQTTEGVAIKQEKPQNIETVNAYNIKNQEEEISEYNNVAVSKQGNIKIEETKPQILNEVSEGESKKIEQDLGVKQEKTLVIPSNNNLEQQYSSKQVTNNANTAEQASVIATNKEAETQNQKQPKVVIEFVNNALKAEKLNNSTKLQAKPTDVLLQDTQLLVSQFQNMLENIAAKIGEVVKENIKNNPNAQHIEKITIETTSLTKDSHHITVKIHPEELGSIKIEFRKDISGIKVHITAKEPDTLNLLESSAKELKNLINEVVGKDTKSNLSFSYQSDRESKQDKKYQAVNKIRFDIDGNYLIANNSSTTQDIIGPNQVRITV